MADLAALQAQINQQAEALQAANAALEALQLAQQAQAPAAAHLRSSPGCCSSTSPRSARLRGAAERDADKPRT